MRLQEVFANAPLGYGLRSKLREGYTRDDLRADVMAGLVVGVVALPLSMALAIASGVAPQYGLYTTIIAGVVSSLLGGTRCQVTGPTAAFVVILVPIVQKHGLGGLLVAGQLAGLLLVGMGLLGMGKLIQYIPHPVTTGFTAGIAVVIGTIQLKDFLGLRFDHPPDAYFERLKLMWEARATFAPWEFAVGALTLALLVGLPRVIKRIPAPLLALTITAVASALLSRFVPGFHVETIGSRFHSVVAGHTVAGIPPLPPMPVLPWHLPDEHGAPFALTFHLVKDLLPSAFAIAMLGAIESLLAATVADGMSGTRHDPNAELLALGLSNIACPIFAGIPATGALARTATNIRAGARSPFAAVIHAVFILLCTIALAPLVAYLPMAALAGLLLMVAKNMAEARHFAHIVKAAPKSDVTVLVTCFLLTVIFDMVIAVSVGVVLAAMLFMRRMAEIVGAKLDTDTMASLDLPKGVALYEIAGPLFFGAAQKAMSIFDTVDHGTLVVILYLGQVPVMDATGLVALESLVTRLKGQGHKIVLAGLNPQPMKLVEKSGAFATERGRLAFAPDLDTALSLAILHTARTRPSNPVQTAPVAG